MSEGAPNSPRKCEEESSLDADSLGVIFAGNLRPSPH